MSDKLVESPSHYTQSDEIECWRAIRAALGPEGFRAFCRGTVMKYIWRGPHKGEEQRDYEKALWYMNRLVEEKP